MKRVSRGFLCGLFLIIAALVSLAQTTALPAKPTQRPLNQPGEDADFQRYLSSGRISVVAFYADWCPSCRHWVPILDGINRHFPDMQVLFMDIGEWDTPITEQYGIESIPYFKIYDRSASLMVEGQGAREWLRQAIKRRFQASATGAYRLDGQPTKLNVGDAGRSVSTKAQAYSAAARNQIARGRAPVVAATALPHKIIKSSEPLPSVDEVLARYVGAVGGQDAAMKFTTRSAKGRVNAPKLGRGSFVTYAKAPNKFVTTMDIPEVGVIRQGFNGAAGWNHSARTGVRSAAGLELAALKRDADFYSPLRLKVNYPRMKLLGVSKIGFREVYVIEAKPPEGETERLYFSKENGLIIRWDAVRVSLGVRTPAEIYLDDWKDVDGIKMPFTISQLFPGLSFVFTLDEVKHDVLVNDTVFNRPMTK